MVLDRLTRAVGRLFEVDGKESARFNALLLVVALLAVAGVGYTVAVPESSDQYTEFYLLTENQSGELVAEGYPNSIEAERPSTFHVGIENHRNSRTRYAVVVKLQRMFFDNGTARVLEEEELKTVRAPVSADRRRVRPVNVTPSLRGSNMRLVFLLYQSDPPSEPGVQNAYQRTHLWLNVTPPSSAENETGRVVRSPTG